MKNNFKLWAMALLAGGMMASCSTEDVTGSGTSAESTPRYLAVNIVSTGTAGGTRAYPDDPEGSYESGSDLENAVKNMRFYLFNEDGSAYIGKDNKGYVTGTYTATTEDKTNETVEEVGDAVLVIERTTDALPAYIVAVLNAPADLADTYTLDQLKTVTGNYVPTTLDDNTGILMTNSVWNNGTTCGEVSVVGKVEDTERAALDNPVEVYVERAVAKVEVKDGRTNPTEAGLFEVGTDADGSKIYARIEGWQVADYNNAGYLVKQIENTWTDTSLGINPWSTPDFHRSFWATSVPFSESNVIGNANSWEDITSNELAFSVYTLENTPTTAVTNLKTNDLTKVIVAATLVKKNGENYEAAEILKYMGVQYTVNDALTAILAKVNAKSEYFSDQNGTPVAVGDIEFVEGTNPYNAQAAAKEGKTIYTKSGTTYTDATTAFNTALAAEQVLYWTGGKTYYYTTIGHLGSEGSLGEYGVVRNHIYKIGISKISGLGTPVYDPTKPIDPTTPPEEYSYLAARVNILAWKIVNKTVELQ